MKFSLRRVDEIKKDIDTAKAIYEKIKEIAWKSGYGGDMKRVSAAVYENPPNENFRNVALWIHFGEQNVFLQDADSLIMKTDGLLEVIRYLKQTFPGISRVTSYGRSKTAARKPLNELMELHAAGLSRLHVGMESGCDDVLAFVQKGVTAEEHILGGKKVVGSGISLCEYVMPGLGGKKLTKRHAIETARVLNEINPAFIRLRSLSLREDLPLFARLQTKEFEPLSDDETVEEIGEMIQRLQVTSDFRSDHIENLLQEVEGKLPEDKPKMLDVIERYLKLPTEEKLIFQLGRRLGYYEKIHELENPYLHPRLETMLTDTRLRGEDFEELIFSLKRRFLV
jgi:hypothetical protein